MVKKAETMAPTDKEALINNALKYLDNKYGKGIVRRLKDTPMSVERVSSGILSLDIALGGGWPVGRTVEIYGPEAGGKTAIAIYAGIEVQRTGRECGLIDEENAFNPDYAAANGMDVGRLFVSQPDTGEQAFDVMEALALTGQFGCLIFDSVAAAEPRQDAEKEMGDPSIGLQARLMSQCLRRVNPVFAKNKCTAFFINQIREKVGVMYGSPETTPGGRALKFYSSVRCEVRPTVFLGPNGQEVKTREEAVGHRIKVKVIKNKVYVPFKTAEFDFYYGVGVDLEKDVIDVATSLGIINRSGAWFSYGSLKEQGLSKMAEAIKHEGLFEEIRQATLQKVWASEVSPIEQSEEESEEFTDGN